MVRWVVAAAWSVLAFLLLSKTALAFERAPSHTLILNSRDSSTLMSRMKSAVRAELYRSNRLSTKRFATSDGAIRIDCAQHNLPIHNFSPINCSVRLNPTKSVQGVTHIRAGYVSKSWIFRISAKKDVGAVMANIITPYHTKENILVRDVTGKGTSVARFVINCPRDWVFDAVACEGHIITR